MSFSFEIHLIKLGCKRVKKKGKLSKSTRIFPLSLFFFDAAEWKWKVESIWKCMAWNQFPKSILVSILHSIFFSFILYFCRIFSSFMKRPWSHRNVWRIFYDVALILRLKRQTFLFSFSITTSKIEHRVELNFKKNLTVKTCFVTRIKNEIKKGQRKSSKNHQTKETFFSHSLEHNKKNLT